MYNRWCGETFCCVTGNNDNKKHKHGGEKKQLTWTTETQTLEQHFTGLFIYWHAEVFLLYSVIRLNTPLSSYQIVIGTNSKQLPEVTESHRSIRLEAEVWKVVGRCQVAPFTEIQINIDTNTFIIFSRSIYRKPLQWTNNRDNTAWIILNKWLSYTVAITLMFLNLLTKSDEVNPAHLIFSKIICIRLLVN